MSPPADSTPVDHTLGSRPASNVAIERAPLETVDQKLLTVSDLAAVLGFGGFASSSDKLLGRRGV